MTDYWAPQPDIDPFDFTPRTEGATMKETKRPVLRVEYDYVCEEVDYHTCGSTNPHEPDCGLIPICHVDASELTDMECDLITALIKAQAALVEAERRGAERGWDEGALAQARAYGMNKDTGPNPYRAGDDQ